MFSGSGHLKGFHGEVIRTVLYDDIYYSWSYSSSKIANKTIPEKETLQQTFCGSLGMAKDFRFTCERLLLVVFMFMYLQEHIIEIIFLTHFHDLL